MSDDFMAYLRQVMSSEQGRKWVWEILSLTGINARSAPLETVYANYYAGKRCMGETLLGAIFDIPADNGMDGYYFYAQMMREARLREFIAAKRKKESIEHDLLGM